MSIESRVAQARSGNRQARDDLISDYMPFILKTASSQARRYLDVGRDEEISVALQAFDEAISAYSSAKPGFLAFAATVIRRRLIDYYRKENRRDEVPFSTLPDEDERVRSTAFEFASDDWNKALERRDEIAEWIEVLKKFNLTLKDVARATPKHVDARQRAMRTAALIAKDPGLRQKFMQNKRLPIDDLVKTSPEDVASRKTLERQKHYIIGIALILTHNLSSLAEFLDLGR